jgi:hypothetical protein
MEPTMCDRCGRSESDRKHYYSIYTFHVIDGTATCHVCGWHDWKAMELEDRADQQREWKRLEPLARKRFIQVYKDRWPDLLGVPEPKIQDWVLRTWWTLGANAACEDGQRGAVGVMIAYVRKQTPKPRKFPWTRMRRMIDWSYHIWESVYRLLPDEMQRVYADAIYENWIHTRAKMEELEPWRKAPAQMTIEEFMEYEGMQAYERGR